MKNIYKAIVRSLIIAGVVASVVTVAVVADHSAPSRVLRDAGVIKDSDSIIHSFSDESIPVKSEKTAGLSQNAASVIFTNPAEDCSTSMDISWLTAPGKICKIEVIDQTDPHTYIYDYEEGDGKYPNDEPQAVELGYADAGAENVQKEYSIAGSFKDKGNVGGFEKHGYKLTNLKPDTDYSYRIAVYDKATGKEEHSETRHFHTAGARAWKAAILGDFHHYAPEPGRLRSAMGMLDVLDNVSGGVDWVLSTGDECGWGGSLSFWNDLSQQPGFKNYMWAAVEGNHDHMDRYKDKTDDFFRDSHYFPLNGYKGQEGVSYWFKYGDVLFLMLNNEAMLTGGTQQPVEWMKSVVRANPSKYIVVVEHHQWLIGTDGSNGQLDRWRKAFDEMGVDLAISGHNHAYIRTYPLYDRQPVEPGKGTVYVVNSSSDNERGRKLGPIVANKNIIADRWSEGKHTVGGMVMDVNPERIAMTLYDREGHVEDTFTVPARR